jgi:hypothetical protein
VSGRSGGQGGEMWRRGDALRPRGAPGPENEGGKAAKCASDDEEVVRKTWPVAAGCGQEARPLYRRVMGGKNGNQAARKWVWQGGVALVHARREDDMARWRGVRACHCSPAERNGAQTRVG